MITRKTGMARLQTIFYLQQKTSSDITHNTVLKCQLFLEKHSEWQQTGRTSPAPNNTGCYQSKLK